MRCPEIALLKGHRRQGNGHAGHVARLCRQGDHLGNQRLVPPAVGLAPEAVDQGRQRGGILDMAADRIGLDRDPADVEQLCRGRHLIDRILQLARHRIPRCQRKQLRIIRLVELLEDPARGRELHVQQRRRLLRRGQQDELPVAAVRVQIQVIAQLIANLGAVARDIDVEIGLRGFLARQMLQRAVVALHQSGRGHLDEIAEHQALFDQAFHVRPPASALPVRRAREKAKR